MCHNITCIALCSVLWNTIVIEVKPSRPALCLSRIGVKGLDLPTEWEIGLHRALFYPAARALGLGGTMDDVHSFRFPIFISRCCWSVFRLLGDHFISICLIEMKLVFEFKLWKSNLLLHVWEKKHFWEKKTHFLFYFLIQQWDQQEQLKGPITKTKKNIMRLHMFGHIWIQIIFSVSYWPNAKILFGAHFCPHTNTEIICIILNMNTDDTENQPI